MVLSCAAQLIALIPAAARPVMWPSRMNGADCADFGEIFLSEKKRLEISLLFAFSSASFRGRGGGGRRSSIELFPEGVPSLIISK